MKLEVLTFQTAKESDLPSDCEDFLAWNPTTSSFAIADGASDSAFQRLWAEILVRGFVDSAPAVLNPRWLAAWLDSRQDEWRQAIDWAKVPWHGTLKAREVGALATFLGISVSSSVRQWKGICIGDCVLFHFRPTRHHKYRILDWHPPLMPEEFGNRPAAFSSISTLHHRTWEETSRIRGQLEAGDSLALCSDALAKWLASEVASRAGDAEGQSACQIMALRGENEFRLFIEDLRARNRIRVDDTSLMTIRT